MGNAFKHLQPPFQAPREREPLQQPAPQLVRSRTRRTALFAAAAIAVAAVLLVGAGTLISALMPITVSVNGVDVTLSLRRTVQAAYETSGVVVEPGDLYDVEGVLLAEGAGEDYSAAVNGEAAEASTELKNGDEVVFSDGGYTEEESTLGETKTVAPVVVEVGTGPIYTVVQEGEAGTSVEKTGLVSGKTVDVVVAEAVERVYRRWTPDTGEDKVIALTFDDGPTTYTDEILDVLAEYGVKATFFTIGEQVVTESGTARVQRATEEGHQVCTHTWDHARGDGNGVNLGYLSIEDQRQEIIKGLQAIADATGEAPSTVVRAPGGNFTLEIWQNIDDLISAQIGWTIDARDWTQPGAEEIAAAIMGASSGDIVLLHDGGGDRSQTVEALRIAIPYLLEQGYTFVTIDELMEYPAKE